MVVENNAIKLRKIREGEKTLSTTISTLNTLNHQHHQSMVYNPQQDADGVPLTLLPIPWFHWGNLLRMEVDSIWLPGTSANDPSGCHGYRVWGHHISCLQRLDKTLSKIFFHAASQENIFIVMCRRICGSDCTVIPTNSTGLPLVFWWRFSSWLKKPLGREVKCHWKSKASPVEFSKAKNSLQPGELWTFINSYKTACTVFPKGDCSLISTSTMSLVSQWHGLSMYYSKKTVKV